MPRGGQDLGLKPFPLQPVALSVYALVCPAASALQIQMLSPCMQPYAPTLNSRLYALVYHNGISLHEVSQLVLRLRGARELYHRFMRVSQQRFPSSARLAGRAVFDSLECVLEVSSAKARRMHRSTGM